MTRKNAASRIRAQQLQNARAKRKQNIRNSNVAAAATTNDADAAVYDDALLTSSSEPESSFPAPPPPPPPPPPPRSPPQSPSSSPQPSPSPAPFSIQQARRSARLKPGPKRDNFEQENIITNVEKIEEMFQDAYFHHFQRSPECRGTLRLKRTLQLLISSRYELMCDTCSFYTPYSYASYIEENSSTPGHPQPKINLQLSKALLSSSIGPQPWIDLMQQIGIDGGSRQGYHTLMRNKAGPALKDLANKNMAGVRQKLKERFKGQVEVSVDGQYTSVSYNSKNPLQQASQMTFATCEDMTRKKKIIHVQVESKIGPAPTMSKYESIGKEGKTAQKMATDIKADGLEITVVTSDGDGSAPKGVQSIFPNAITQLDTIHVGRSTKRALKKKLNLSKNALRLESKTTQKMHQTIKGAVVQDIASRLYSEADAAWKALGGKDSCRGEDFENKYEQTCLDMQLMLFMCYQNDHSLCQERSFVCKPKEDSPWHFPYMPDYLKESGINFDADHSDSDLSALAEAFHYRLSKKMVNKTRMNKNTQKNESVNRTFSKMASKNNTYRSSYPARISAAVLSRNEGFFQSTMLMAENGDFEYSNTLKRKIEKNDMNKLKRLKRSRSTKQKLLRKKNSAHIFQKVLDSKMKEDRKNNFFGEYIKGGYISESESETD